MLELIIFLLFLQAESGNVVKVDTFFFAVTRLRTNRTKWLVWDFARTIFCLFLFLSYDYCCCCSSFNSCNLLCFSSHKPMFQNKECDASVGSIAKAFVPTGMLNSDSADVVLYSLRQKYRDTDKLIVPRWVTVSILLFL